MVDSVPNIPSKISASVPSIKIADPDIILQNDSEIPIEIMTDLIFEDIGGQEIINISRNDLVNGQYVVYQPIKNLSYIASQYNSKNIVGLGGTLGSYFDSFPIKLEDKMPNNGLDDPNYYPIYLLDDGSLVIELVNMESDEQVEVQIMTSGSILDDTIYLENE